jgi:hypothetical protein
MSVSGNSAVHICLRFERYSDIDGEIGKQLSKALSAERLEAKNRSRYRPQVEEVQWSRQ